MTQISIAELIATPKTITETLRNKGNDPVHARLELSLTSEVPGKFQAFLRVKRALQENFSIGLRYFDDDGRDVILFRVNGDHGRHRNPDGGLIASGAHVHGFRGPMRELPPRNGAEARWAWPISPDHLSLMVAWRTFCVLANLESERKFERAVGKLYTPPRQLSFEAFR